MAIYTVPAYSQRTENLCWEACARMMWRWRHRNLTRYAAAAGPHYLGLNRGLSEQEMDTFYRRLGLRALARPGGANLRHALRWTPVIFTSIHRVSGHAMVLAGYAAGKYHVVNPCAVQAVEFAEDGEASAACTAGTVRLPPAEVERALGRFIWYW